MDEDNELWQRLIAIGLVAAIVLLIGGYLGWLHPLADSLSVGRGMAATAVLLLAVAASFVGLRMAAFGSLLLAMVTGGQVLLAYNWPGPPGSYLLYQKNMLYRNSDLAGLEADIRAANPAIVTLQEVSDANLAMVEALKDRYPHQHFCPGGRVGGVAILTELEPVAGTAFCAPRLAAMQVVDAERRFWVVSLHLSWPWPYNQGDHVRELLPVLDKLEGPAVMAGDFNMVRWAISVKRLADILGVRPAGPTTGSYIGWSRWAALPIDHVFATRSGRVVPRGALGSDHLGLLANVEP